MQGQFSKVKKGGEFVKLLTDSQSTYLTGHIFDTKENLYFYYKRKSYISLCTINKADQSNYFLESINNDINSIVIPLPEFINENYFVSIVYPYLIKKQSTFLSSTSDFQSKYRDLKQLSDRLSYDDNPVICLMHLKN